MQQCWVLRQLLTCRAVTALSAVSPWKVLNVEDIVTAGEAESGKRGRGAVWGAAAMGHRLSSDAT